MNWLKQIGCKLVGTAKPLPKIIIVGIDTHCYQLAQSLLQHRDVEIVAFIDDEPWSNRTELLGAKVHYPSDMVALVNRREVNLIIDFEGSELVPESIQSELDVLPLRQVCLPHGLSEADWRKQVLQQLANEPI